MAAQTQTAKWRLKGAGDLHNLPHVHITDALDFLTSGDNFQHVAYGTRRIRRSDGAWRGGAWRGGAR